MQEGSRPPPCMSHSPACKALKETFQRAAKSRCPVLPAQCFLLARNQPEVTFTAGETETALACLQTVTCLAPSAWGGAEAVPGVSWYQGRSRAGGRSRSAPVCFAPAAGCGLYLRGAGVGFISTPTSQRTSPRHVGCAHQAKYQQEK